MKQLLPVVGDMIQLVIVRKVYGKKSVIRSVEGQAVVEELDVLVKEIKLKKWFKKDAFSSIEQVLTKDNRVSKTRSIVFDRYSGQFFETYHPESEIMNALYASTMTKTSIGFNNGSTISRRKSLV
jgi:hypothetical protein